MKLNGPLDKAAKPHETSESCIAGSARNVAYRDMPGEVVVPVPHKQKLVSGLLQVSGSSFPAASLT